MSKNNGTNIKVKQTKGVLAKENCPIWFWTQTPYSLTERKRHQLHHPPNRTSLMDPSVVVGLRFLTAVYSAHGSCQIEGRRDRGRFFFISINKFGTI